MARVLIADDEHDFRSSVAELLRRDGHDVQDCATADEALALLRKDVFDVVLTDLRMPGVSALVLLREAASRFPDAILIVLTAYASLESAIEALRIGAHDYLLKPVRLESLARRVDFFARHQSALAENRCLRTALDVDLPASGLVGSSKALAEVHRLIAKVAPTDSTVLITGETGTGKELVARALQQASPRKDRPFVPINCGSIPESLLESELFGYVRGAFTGADRDKTGLFEVAGTGTIFLDEIGEMPLQLQPKLLRALEFGEILRVGSTAPVRVSARIVAATHRDLPRMVGEGKFRPDLYYRLNVFEIRMPPLREHPEDLRPIAFSVLERLCRRMNRPVPALDPEALLALEGYRWPGNVRELVNVLERALILSPGPRLGLEELPGLINSGPPAFEDDLKAARLAFERAHIRRVLEKHGNDKPRAAEALGIDVSSIYRKLQGG